MRFKGKRARLAEVAGLVSQAVSGKSTKKIFECMRIAAGDQGVELSGTDLDVAIRYRVGEDVQVDEAGEAVVPAHLLANVLREVADETVAFHLARRKLTLDTDGGHFELECEDPVQFPEIPEFPGSDLCSVASSDLRELVSKTSFAAGREASRFVLNGVKVSVGQDRIRFVATDGRRLALLERPVVRDNGREGRETSAIVGVKALGYFERVAAEVDGPVEIALADRFVAVRTARAEVTGRVMDGSFPDVDQIIPKDVPHTASLPAGVFFARLKQARQFASVESQSVALAFAPGELKISAAGGDGRAEVRLGIEYDGPEQRIGFNPAFLLDALKASDGERVRFSFKNANGAAKLEDEKGLVYVLMPVLLD